MKHLLFVYMVADPGEMRNLALDPAFAPVLTDHRRLLLEWYRQNGGELIPKYVVSGNQADSQTNSQ